MTTIPQFRDDNTEGYSPLELRLLNAAFDTTVAQYGAGATAEDRQYVGERVLEQFDTRLHRAISASGLSARQFATTVLSRDERTVRRWLAGEPIPDAVTQWLALLVSVRITAHTLTIRLRVE